VLWLFFNRTRQLRVDICQHLCVLKSNTERAFADDIIAFFESEEGQKEYEEWLQQKKENENKKIA
jgi:hypothetical protein